MKAMINRAHIEGLLYSHSLELKITGDKSKNPGTQFISGTIDIATDDACLNIVSVHFTYVTATTAKGSANATFTTLANVISGTYPTVVAAGKENAAKMTVDTAVALNDFYTDRNGTVELVSAKRNEGGFVHVVQSLRSEAERNKTQLDIVIYGTAFVEANEERNLPEKLIVKGYIFNFRNDILPVEFSVLNPNAIAYFEGLDASEAEPVFTQVYVNQIAQTGTRTVETESAWGDTIVNEYQTTHKDFVIYNAVKEPYDFGDAEVLTKTDIKTKLAEREVMLATVKARWEEYKNSNSAVPASAPAASAGTAAKGGFNF